MKCIVPQAPCKFEEDILELHHFYSTPRHYCLVACFGDNRNTSVQSFECLPLFMMGACTTIVVF